MYFFNLQITSHLTTTHTHTQPPPIPQCPLRLQSPSIASVLQGVNVKLPKLDETLLEIL